MKVILLKTIDKLGKAGEVITVKEGYARNYLIPKNAAREATAGNMKIMDSLKKKQAEEDAKKLAEIKTVAEKLGALWVPFTFVIKHKGNRKGEGVWAMRKRREDIAIGELVKREI